MNDSIQIKVLNEKIQILQLKVDSLNNNAVLNKIQYELNDRQDIITQVNDFYDSAWLKLIIVISVLGILVPIIAQYFQRKNLKDLTEFIRKQMNDSFDSKIDELKNFNEREMTLIASEFKDKISSVENQNKNLLNELDASTYYLQGRASVNSKNYYLAILSFLKSAYLWLQTERPERIKIMFVNLRLALKGLNEHKYYTYVDEQLKKSKFEMSIDEYIEYFKAHENLELYTEQLDKVEAEFNRLKAIPEAQNE